MKKHRLFRIAALGVPVLVLATLGTSIAYAAETTSSTTNTNPTHITRTQLTDAQKALLEQAKILRADGKTIEASALLKQAGLSGFGNRRLGGGGPPGRINRTNHDAIEKAIEANDFTAYTALIKGSPMEGKIDATQFAKLVQAHALIKSGDTAGAKVIFGTLGLSGPMHGKAHEARGGVFGNQAARNAVSNNDFAAWKTSMKDFPNQSVLTQDLFDKMVKAQTLQHEIHDTLGQK